jgi:uncharacterized protein YbjT (DUF2867 family)
MATARMLVTDGTGRAGHAVIEHLVDRGYDVVNVDVRPTRELIRRFLPGVNDLRRSLEERAALLSNRRANERLGWKQRCFLL